jgi:hypothetical protein
MYKSHEPSPIIAKGIKKRHTVPTIKSSSDLAHTVAPLLISES